MLLSSSMSGSIVHGHRRGGAVALSCLWMKVYSSTLDHLRYRHVNENVEFRLPFESHGTDFYLSRVHKLLSSGGSNLYMHKIGPMALLSRTKNNPSIDFINGHKTSCANYFRLIHGVNGRDLKLQFLKDIFSLRKFAILSENASVV